MKSDFFDSNESEFNYEALIIVEGTDDAFLINDMLGELNARKESVRIVIANGKDKISSRLNLILKSHYFDNGTIKKYSIIRDADEDFIKSFEKLKYELERLGEPVAPIGEFANRDDGRKNIIYFLPAKDRNGDLETLILDSLSDNILLNEAIKFVDDSSQIGGRGDHKSKRVTQAFLSVVSHPICAGVAFSMHRKDFSYDVAAFDQLKDFLRSFLEA